MSKKNERLYKNSIILKNLDKYYFNNYTIFSPDSVQSKLVQFDEKTFVGRPAVTLLISFDET